MLLRGLPEMSIKDIQFRDVVITSRRGGEVIEASNVSLVNVALDCAVSNPLINIENSHHLSFAKVRALTPPVQFYGVNGERSRDIRVDSASQRVQFGYGAEERAVRMRVGR
jgi:hypothetical protein